MGRRFFKRWTAQESVPAGGAPIFKVECFLSSRPVASKAADTLTVVVRSLDGVELLSISFVDGRKESVATCNSDINRGLLLLLLLRLHGSLVYICFVRILAWPVKLRPRARAGPGRRCGGDVGAHLAI